jgi:hypothetical protein
MLYGLKAALGGGRNKKGLAGSRLVNAPMPVTLGMKRFHPILPSTRANYFQDMFTTYPTTSI